MVLGLWVGPVLAQDPVTDAFGVFVPTEDLGDRKGWSGLQVQTGDFGTRYSRVAPGEVDRIEAFNGPKSLVAGRDKGHFVVIATDALGNAVRDGTAITYRMGSAEDGRATTRNGIAAHWYDPGETAGLFHAGAFVGGVQSARTEYRVVPDLSRVFISAEVQANLLPDGIARIYGAPMTDAMNNTVSDGTALQLALRSQGDALSIVPASVLLGQAVSRFHTLGMPVRQDGLWTMGQTQSAAFPVTVDPLVLSGVLRVTARDLPELEALSVVVGPFLSEAGYHLNDGTLVDLDVTRNRVVSSSHQGWLDAGYAAFVLPVQAADLPVDLTVEGRFGRQTVTVSSDDLIAEGTR